MKALILVGGFGTRLRPLTFSFPKPIVEFANIPIVEHQIAALAKVGVTEIILAVGFQPTAMIEPIKRFEQKYKVKITCSQETEPLGTAGPIKLAQELLSQNNPEKLFFVFNSDIICEFPLKELIAFHKSHKKQGTIFLTKVEDPSKYGVVLSDKDTGRIQQFVEKPKNFISDKINAGLYIFNTDMIDRIPMKPTMLEKAIFPQMAQEGDLFSLELPGFWMDVGQPKDFLCGTTLILESYKKLSPERLYQKENVIGNVLVDESSKIDPTAIIGPNVTIGPDCVVEEGVRLKNVVLMKGAVVRAHSWIDNSIIGWKSSVGKWVRIEGVTVLGEDVHINDELFINGSSVLPHKSVSASVTEKNTIIM